MDSELLEAFHAAGAAIKRIKAEMKKASGKKLTELAKRSLGLAFVRKEFYTRLRTQFGAEAVRGLKLTS